MNLFIRRAALCLLGNFVLAIGVAVTVKADMGITPVNSIAFVMSRVFSLDHGLMTGVIYAGYVLIQLAILRKEFRLNNLLQGGAALVFGWFVFLCNHALAFPVPQFYPARLLFLLAGIGIIGLGIMLYLRADILPQPAEGLILAIQKKTGWKLHNIKVVFDSSVVVIAAAVSFIITKEIVGIREGTLISMIGIGKCLGFFTKHLGGKIDALFRLPG
ncbi:MAG: DUF6198 family protein [Treponema sp.]|jgi:uncharacterized membrane protein YczE|nr:DUF6198 family protein [Treponema sp.]